jgi:hypothetical protein
MEEKTRLPELTPPNLRVGGVTMIVAAAAMPPLAWMLASSASSLGGLLLAPVGWAVIALVGYAVLGRTVESRKFAVLVTGCAALWAIVLSAAFWFIVRREFDAASPVAVWGKLAPADVMSLFGLGAATTGATYGFFSGIRYRDLPRTFPRALRASAWAVLPALALCLLVFGFNIANRYAAFALLAPFVVALAVTAVAKAMEQPATTPSGIS